MKKFIFLAICLFTAGMASAQNYYDGRRPPRRYVRHERPRRQYDDFNQIKIGFTAGLNVANSIDAYDSRFSSSSIAGFNAGLTFDIPVAYPFSFAPEILFSQKGFSSDLADAHFTERTNYIDIPLLAKFRIVRGFNFLIGPQLTFLTSQRDTYREFGTNVETRFDGHQGDQSYVAGVVGISVDINRNVEIRGRYNIDLSRNSSNEDQLPDFRNQVWQIGLGFKFQ
ncbi:MAG: outer membrane protein beta-barrel protein [Mucilaginibacter sp.]|nr:outer membrane protein beta-barrel protein [Mucilaginibacter sp.]